MSSNGEAAPQNESPNSAPASPRDCKSLGTKNTREPSGVEALSDQHGRICNVDKEPVADEIADDQCIAEAASSGHSAVALEIQQRSPDLCKYCQKMVDNLPYDSRDELVVEHHGTEAGLSESARAGCIICNHLSAQRHPLLCEFRLEDGCWKHVFSGFSLPAASSESHPPGMASLSNEYFGAYERYEFSHFKPAFDQEARTNGAMQCRYQQRRLGFLRHKEPHVEALSLVGTTHSTLDGLPISKYWHNLCKNTHQICGISVESTFKPTRLVELSSSKPVLRTTFDLDPNCKYATLSHCWGSTNYAVLTHDMLSSYLHEIPEEAMSITFKEAFFVARYLGFHYIWIDSLCIIQDSKDDWRQESALMSKVYGNSSLNISAAGAEDGSIGCFFPRPSNWLDSRKISSSMEGIRLQYICHDHFFENEDLDNMPLMQRGWALQERILASRTLHFAKSQLFWECNELHACESLPCGFYFQGRKTKLDSDDGSFETLQGWERLVIGYSACQLSESKDKLVAISGIAQAVQSELLGSYVAGLWRNCLESRLGWYRSGSLEHRPVGYRAPTWSWASVDGLLSFNDSLTGEPSLVRVHDVVVQNVTEGDVYGQVLSGTLSLSCQLLLPVDISRLENKGHPHDCVIRMGGKDLDVFFYPDSIEDSILEGSPATRVYLVPLRMPDGYNEGLALTPEGVIPGQYRRSGYFFIDYNFDNYFDGRLEQEIRAARYHAPSDAYARIITGDDGKQLKIIDIV